MKRAFDSLRVSLFGIAVGSACLLGLNAVARASGSDAPENGAMSFVVADFGYVIGPTVCPSGTSQGYRELFAASPAGQRRTDESDNAYSNRLDQVGYTGPIRNGQSVCMNPELGDPDPHFRIMSSLGVRAGGIDLDGQDSRSSARPAPGTCAHDDFRAPDGVRGVDNQFLRVVGCGRVWHEASHQTGTQSGLTVEMLTGSWGVLIALRGVDDTHNDDNVVVDIYANADPIALGPDRAPLANVTYSPERDPRFHATARGRIVAGVLTTEPMDMRFHSVLNGMLLERPLREGRLRLRFTDDGALEGNLGGYTPLEAMYDMEFGFRNGVMRDGTPAPLPLRTITGVGKASVLGYTCEGAYQALQRLADGHRDPSTGRCTSISTQYHLRAIPAFIAEPAQ